MITWAFAYMITHGIAVPWYAFGLSIFVDLFMVSTLSDRGENND